MTKPQIRELSLGFQAGYSHGLWERENYNKLVFSNWTCLYKDNLRKMIHGCSDDYDLVAIYWQGYISGFVKAASVRN
jgi:hypothetical protein